MLLVFILLLPVSVVGHRRDFVLGCPLAAAAAAILSCSVQPDRWIAPHLAVRLCLIVVGGIPGYSTCSLYPSLACFLVTCCS